MGDNFVNNIIFYETEISKYTMTPEQSREYDKYYTNTTLDELYLNINELKSLDSKKDNYSEDKECFINDDNTKQNIKTLFKKYIIYLILEKYYLII